MLATVMFALLASEDGFRCPDTSKLISLGDTTMLVRRKCRDPDDVTRRTETRSRRVYTQTRHGRSFAEEQYQVEVEEWLYDFGASRFMRRLTFENHALAAVASLGYGN